MVMNVEKILDSYIRPRLNKDGGDIKLLSYNDGILNLRLMGQCCTCPLSSDTIESFINVIIKEKLPEVKNIIVETGISEEMLDIAREYLRKDR